MIKKGKSNLKKGKGVEVIIKVKGADGNVISFDDTSVESEEGKEGKEKKVNREIKAEETL